MGQNVGQDIQDLQAATAHLAEAIAQCDVKLNDIQILQSMMLAQEAAMKGDEKFRTVERIDDLPNAKVNEEEDWSDGDNSSVGAPSSPPNKVPMRQRIKSSWGNLSNKAKERLSMMKQAAARVDQHRLANKPQYFRKASENAKGHMESFRLAVRRMDSDEDNVITKAKNKSKLTQFLSRKKNKEEEEDGRVVTTINNRPTIVTNIPTASKPFSPEDFTLEVKPMDSVVSVDSANLVPMSPISNDSSRKGL